MPTCSLCGGAFAYRTGWEPPERCDCGANEEAHQPQGKKPRPEDYEPTDELEGHPLERGGRNP